MINSRKALRPGSILAALILASLYISCNGYSKVTGDTGKDMGYVIGHRIGTDLKKNGYNVDIKTLIAGIKDGYDSKPSVISEEEGRKISMDFEKKRYEEHEKTMKVEGDKNVEAGKKFMESIKANANVKELTKGIYYEVIKSGSGTSPKATDSVKVHYKGTLVDGTEFDSSYTRGEPAVFKLNQVIPGWTESLSHMKPGDKWKIYLPPEMAYGPRSAGDKIGPNSTLVFEVELISVNK